MQTYPHSPLAGQMMDQPLAISSILQFAARHYGATEIVSRPVEPGLQDTLHRYTWRDCERRARRMARALAGRGVAMGERVGTLAWNGYRHLELYYAVSGSGAVLHTINPRLHPEQIAYIVNHAQDRILCFDITFLALVEAIAPHCPEVRAFVLMTDRAHMPDGAAIPNLLCYEDLLDGATGEDAWPVFDENAAAALCYTSGTTGNPKGVLYSHRSTVLHAYASALPNVLNVGALDTVLPVVPMFHVNAWGLPYSAPLTGARLVLPGAALDGKSLYDLFEAEGVTFSAGVPTVWRGLVDYVVERGLRFSTFRRTVIGGAACPPALMDTLIDTLGVQVIHGWGMTEMSPLGTTGGLLARHRTLPAAEQRALLRKQGHAIFGVDMKIVDDVGAELPWDGRTAGHLLVRGPWIAARYFRDEGGDILQDGWFPTGDVATIDADGFMQVTDRSKDVIKSGGEWIGSIDLENIAMAHPAVLQAACIGVSHPKWDERPLLLVQRRPGMALGREELLRFFEGKVARFWMPDDVVFVEALPTGATGKIQKNRLREQFKAHRLPAA
ncbi:3-(methylthio)propionyl-CoA ligase [uncultured Massilia sp.]|uniref:3-(methylthio)propionyl-CoA ligase n=1 Tax=uncultured Massilia sp. TaxID=169973 RepID=UPI0025FC224B|nr:3-(methylthio)propionyl-CoA ligase [uncultured Massilia sp.]